MNVFVQRLVQRFGEIDQQDAVTFAEGILDDARRIKEPRSMSVPGRRYLNLALAYLQNRFPFQCCESGKGKPMCPDCPMQALDVANNKNRTTDAGSKG
jgi:hypothetical protein